MASSHASGTRGRAGEAPGARLACLGFGLVALFTLSGCPSHLCLTAESGDHLFVKVWGPVTFVDGTYELLIDADHTRVEFALAYDSDDATCLSTQEPNRCSASVDVGDGLRLDASVFATVDGWGVHLSYERSDRDAGGPQRVRLRVLRDGLTIGDQTFQPIYAREEPDGEGCGVQIVAREELVLDGSARSQPAALPPGPPR